MSSAGDCAAPRARRPLRPFGALWPSAASTVSSTGVAAGVAADAQEGLERAAEAVDSGRAQGVLDGLIAYSQRVVAA